MRAALAHAAWLTVSLLTARDLGGATPHVDADAAATDVSDLGESMNGAVTPSSLPEGGYLRHRSPPALEHEACQASAPKAPLQGRLERAVVLAAAEQLGLPMGFGRRLTLRGRAYLFCAEPHYHAPGSGVGPEGWHKGVTVYRAEPPELRVL